MSLLRACVPALVLLVGVHWLLLDYRAPFGGQQLDDDYHYFSFATRFAAADPFDLPAYREPRPDRLDAADEARLDISFSNAMPYPLWTYAAYLLMAGGLSYQMAAFVLFVAQAALFAVGAVLIARAMKAPAWAAACAIVLVLGVDPFPSPYLSIPMNFAAALCMAALGLLLHGRKWLGAALLLGAVAAHVAALALAFFVLLVWTIVSRDVGRAAAVAAMLAAAWALLYFVLLKTNRASVDVGLTMGFDRGRLDYLLHAMHRFVPMLALCGAVVCVLGVATRTQVWLLPGACLMACALASLAFLLIGTKHPAHPALHPAGRVMYLAPMLTTFALFMLCGALARHMRTTGIMCAAALAAVVVAQDRVMLESQFAHRRGLSLGPLHEELRSFAADPALPETAFVFHTHDYGTVLSAARLYYGRYFWAKVYSPEELRRQALASSRVVYLEGPQDPAFRIAGFCERSQKVVRLAPRPERPEAPTVRIVLADKC